MTVAKRKPHWKLMPNIKDTLRVWPALLAMAILLAIVYWIAPQQIGIFVYSQCKLFAAGYSGYLLDRWIYPEDRVDAIGIDQSKIATDQKMAQYRRAGIVAACVIGTGLMS